MATTEVHVLVAHWVGDDNDCTATFVGWTEDEAWDAFLKNGREMAEEDRDFCTAEEYEQRIAEYASREAFAAAYGPNDVYIDCHVHHLPA